MYIIILGLIGGAGYLYYTDTQKRLKVAAERNATLTITKENTRIYNKKDGRRYRT